MQLWQLQSTHQSQTTDTDFYNDQIFVQHCQSYLHMKWGSNTHILHLLQWCQVYRHLNKPGFVSNIILIAFFNVINALVFTRYY